MDAAAEEGEEEEPCKERKAVRVASTMLLGPQQIETAVVTNRTEISCMRLNECTGMWTQTVTGNEPGLESNGEALQHISKQALTVELFGTYQ